MVLEQIFTTLTTISKQLSAPLPTKDNNTREITGVARGPYREDNGCFRKYNLLNILNIMVTVGKTVPPAFRDSSRLL